ncbi:MAG: DMT family transporter [Gammaproteobacteria bacterium]|nr:DMT family transporter [Gammaproteobacteria bacterium]
MHHTPNYLVSIIKLLALLFALFAFAANSVLCRMALGEDNIDAASFTIIRLLSGAAILFLMVQFLNKPEKPQHLTLRPLKQKRLWIAPLMLFMYAVLFSFAYLELTTATGALVLFVTVQITMVAYQVYKGNSLTGFEWFGLIIALFGFLVLLLPTAQRPSIIGLLLMIGSGIAWAIYTIEGKQSETPLRDTAENFIGSIPMVLGLMVITVWFAELSWKGVGLAVISGAFASGVGYALWYLALPRLSMASAAVSQLSVPLIAAVGGVWLVGESLSLQLILATIFIIGGIFVVSLGKPNVDSAENKIKTASDSV